MMKYLIPFSFFIMNSVSSAELDWHKSFCEKCEPKSTLENAMPSNLVQISELVKQGDLVEASIQKQIDHWGDFIRWVNNEPTKKVPPEEFSDRLKNLMQEAEAIVEVNRELGAAKRRFNICMNNCSASRKLELLDEIERLEKLNLSLNSLSPWWISEEFKAINEKAADNYEYIPDQKTLKKAFTASMGKFFTDAFEIRRNIHDIKSKFDQSLKNKKTTLGYKELLYRIIAQNGSTLDLLLQRGITSGSLDLCQIADAKNSIDKIKHYTGNTITYGLTAISLLAGPEGLLAALSIRSAGNLGKIALTSSKTPLLAGMTNAGKLLYERSNLDEKCSSELSSGKLSSPDVKAWENCIQKKETYNISIILTGLSAGVPKVIQLMKRVDRSPAIELIGRPDNKMMAILDLSEKRALQLRNINEAPERYWKHVGEIYRKRLNLTDDEIKSFLETSKSFEPRTKLVMQTSGGGPATGKIEGGVGIVTSKNPNELLPLEKAMRIKLPREKGQKIAEVVRLTSDVDKLMPQLLTQISNITKKDPEITTLYVYTSKIHERLYKSLHIPYEKIEKSYYSKLPQDLLKKVKKNERDVLIQVNVKDFQKAFENSAIN